MAKIIRKVFMNKNNKQLSVPLSKRQIKKIHPTIKFGEELFVEIKIIRRKNK